MADATVDSWKDEFALVVLLAPAILVFIPGMKDAVNSVLEAVKESFYASRVAAGIIKQAEVGRALFATLPSSGAAILQTAN